jgi:hypothetical protein
MYVYIYIYLYRVPCPPKEDPEEAGTSAEAGAVLKTGVEAFWRSHSDTRHGRAADPPCTTPLPLPTPCTQNLRESSRETTVTDEGLYVVPQWTPDAV